MTPPEIFTLPKHRLAQATARFSGMALEYLGFWQPNVQIPQSVISGSALTMGVAAGGATIETVTGAVH